MFETLSERLSGALEKLTGKGALNEGDIGVALREVRVALLEADVSLTVARSFIKRVQEKATGGAVLKSSMTNWSKCWQATTRSPGNSGSTRRLRPS